MMTRWPLFTSLLGMLILAATPAQAVVLTADIFRDAALRYASGQGVEQDSQRALRLYCIAALHGDAESAHQLGLMYTIGQPGVNADRSIAAGWFRHATANGDTRSGQLMKQLAGETPAPDPVCPVTQDNPDRETIKTWVRLLAPEYGIDPRLVFALITVESNFNPRALSPSNAHGLMQLMPSTARRFGVTDIWDPVQNISGGLSYLRWLMEYYSGKLRLVLSAYNAGEHAVDRYDKVPPYDETKRYVLRILVKYRKYIHPVDPLPITEAGYETVDVAGKKVVMLTPRNGDPE